MQNDYHLYNNPPPPESLLSESLIQTNDKNNYNQTIACYLNTYNMVHDKMVNYFNVFQYFIQKFNYYFPVEFESEKCDEVYEKIKETINKV